MLSEAETFEEFLQKQKLAARTIKGHLNDLERFKKWCIAENMDYENCNYNELLKFIQYHQNKESSKATINIYLSSISKYYNYLIMQGKSAKNPARDLRVMREGKKVLQNILTTEQLEKIYDDYANKPQWGFRVANQKLTHRRNTVILGLLIYQGLHTAELKRLEKSHIHLTQGSIYIPSISVSSSRILKLSPVQMLPLQQYINGEGAVFSFSGENLFTGNTHSMMTWLMQELRKASKLVKSARQIRASVITNWLKQHNLRQVQYMAGHKHIGSTERYKQEDLEDLQKQLELLHPMR